MTTWLNENLKTKVRKVFEPEYKRRFSDKEVVQMAENLTDFMEGYLKFKLRQYENSNQTSKY